MKKFVSILLVMVLMLSLMACSNDSIIGKWNPEGVEDLEEALMEITETEMIILGAAIPYTLDGSKIIIETDGDDEVIDYKIEGDKLIFSADEETQVFIRFKD